MQAPVYLPAARYLPPVTEPYRLSVEGCPVGELMAIPEAWAIVVKHAPSIKIIVTIPEVVSQLGLMTMVDFATFSGQHDLATYAAIDAELQSLPLQGGGLCDEHGTANHPRSPRLSLRQHHSGRDRDRRAGLCDIRR